MTSQELKELCVKQDKATKLYKVIQEFRNAVKHRSGWGMHEDDADFLCFGFKVETDKERIEISINGAKSDAAWLMDPIHIALEKRLIELEKEFAEL